MLAIANPIQGVQKIAVLRANAVGDLVFSLPALNALRKAYPQAEIVLLAREWHLRFFHNRPAPVDRVVVVPQTRGVNGPPGREETVEEDERELAEFFSWAAGEQFDLAVQLHGGGRYSNPFTLKLGARLTVGLKTPDAVPLDRWVPYDYFQPEVLRFLEVVSLVGAGIDNLEPQVAVTAADLEESRQACPGDRPLVCLHPGAGDPRRRWAPEKFARVGDEFAKNGFQVTVTGTAPEHELVDRVRGAMQADSLDLCGRISLGGLVGLFARASLVISNDTGPLHLAAAAGARTVGIYWIGNLINAGPATRTRHRPQLSWQMTCRVCGRNLVSDPCEHRESFVDEVTSQQVLAAAMDLVGPEGAQPATSR